MISLAFDLENKRAVAIFGKAMIDYASEQTPDAEEVVGPVSEVSVSSFDTPEPVTVTEPPPVVVAPSEPAETPLIVDDNNVAFDPKFCGKARQPFYTTTKRKGQWKRRQGVDENEYDIWYASQLLPAPQVVEPPVQPQQPATTEAFSGQPEPNPVPSVTIPQGAGEMMLWISEQMNAGHLTQGDVDNAYSVTQLTPAQLFSGDPAAISNLHNALQGVLK